MPGAPARPPPSVVALVRPGGGGRTCHPAAARAPGGHTRQRGSHVRPASPGLHSGSGRRGLGQSRSGDSAPVGTPPPGPLSPGESQVHRELMFKASGLRHRSLPFIFQDWSLTNVDAESHAHCGARKPSGGCGSRAHPLGAAVWTGGCAGDSRSHGQGAGRAGRHNHRERSA